MSNIEIYDALFADQPKLKIKAESLISKKSKLFKKGGRFPAWMWEEYTHQISYNRYLISFYAPTVAHADNPIIDYIAFLKDGKQEIATQWGCWPYRKHGSMTAIMMRAISYYSPHFFKRYRERVWSNLDISYNELLCRYFSRNKVNIPIEMNEEIKRNYKKYGDTAAVSFQQHDGFCFIRHWCEGDELSIGTDNSDAIAIVFYMTIITNSLMSELQKNAISKEGRRYLTEFHKNLFEDAMHDALFRRLNETHQGQIDCSNKQAFFQPK